MNRAYIRRASVVLALAITATLAAFTSPAVAEPTFTRVQGIEWGWDNAVLTRRTGSPSLADAAVAACRKAGDGHADWIAGCIDGMDMRRTREAANRAATPTWGDRFTKSIVDRSADAGAWLANTGANLTAPENVAGVVWWTGCIGAGFIGFVVLLSGSRVR